MTWRTATFVVWAVLAAGVAAIQVAAIASTGRWPTLAGLARAATSHPVARGAVLLGWMWLGWHAFAR